MGSRRRKSKGPAQEKMKGRKGRGEGEGSEEGEGGWEVSSRVARPALTLTGEHMAQLRSGGKIRARGRKMILSAGSVVALSRTRRRGRCRRRGQEEVGVRARPAAGRQIALLGTRPVLASCLSLSLMFLSRQSEAPLKMSKRARLAK